MLFVPNNSQGFATILSSWDTTRPAAANGVSVTPNAASNAYGTPVAIGSALTSNCYGIMLNINNNSGAVASRNSAIQLMVDEAGGTSYVAKITGLLCGSAAPYTVGGGIFYYFPIFIKSGSTLAVAARGSVATAFNVGYIIYQQPFNPDSIRVGAFSETLGITVGTGTVVGTTVVPGTTSDGAWTSIGTTTNAMWWWQVGVQLPVGDTSWGAAVLHLDIGWGGATPDVIIRDMPVTFNAAEQLSFYPPWGGCEKMVPAGATLYARLQSSATLETGNYTVGIYGIGG